MALRLKDLLIGPPIPTQKLSENKLNKLADSLYMVIHGHPPLPEIGEMEEALPIEEGALPYGKWILSQLEREAADDHGDGIKVMGGGSALYDLIKLDHGS